MALTKGDKLISGGVKSRAIDVDYDNTSSGLEAATVQEAIDQVAEKPGITYTLTQDSEDKKKLTFTPSEGTPTVITTQDTWVANTKDRAGYVSAPGAAANKVWKTDADGNPGWREDTAATGEGGEEKMNKVDAEGSGSFSINRKNGTTVGSNSIALSSSTTASACATASGDSSIAIGMNAQATGNKSVAIGTDCSATATNSTSMGFYSKSSGSSSFAAGYNASTSSSFACAVGQYCNASGTFSNAFGYAAKATNLYSMATGYQTTCSQQGGFTEGYQTSAAGSGYGGHAEGYKTTSTMPASQYGSHSEGYQTYANGSGSHAEGFQTYANSLGSHAEGCSTTANVDYSHAEGYNTSTTAYGAHAEGFYCVASGSSGSHAGGFKTTAINTGSYSIGHRNAAMAANGYAYNTTGTAFAIGNGTSDSKLSNAFSVQYNGIVKAASTITGSTTADYAEFFEWVDGNPNDEDRVGYFVTLDGNKVKIANNNDYILGIVSGEPFVLGNGDCDVWNGMFLRDKFRRKIMEPVIVTEDILNNEGEVIGQQEVLHGTRPLYNSEYDPEKPYVSRADRKEWAAIGMLGVLPVYHDGTAKVNGYVTVNENGIATACDGQEKNSYRVIKENAEDVVEIIFK